MLLIRIKPFSDESLSGFTFRTALENEMDELTWILLLYAEKFGETLREQDLNWLQVDQLKGLSELLGHPIEVLEKMTFESFNKTTGIPIGTERKSAWLLHNTTKLCPLCVTEERYHRIWWSMTHATMCPIHHLFLIDSCSACHRKFRPRECVTGKCVCGTEIGVQAHEFMVTDQKVIRHQMALQAFVCKRSCYVNSWIKSSTDFFLAVEFIANWIALLTPLEEMPGIQELFLHMKVNTRYRLKRNKPWEHAVIVYSFAHDVLQNWPTNFHHFLNQIQKVGAEAKIKTFIESTLPQLIGSPLEPIFVEFFRYIAQKLNNITDLISQHEACKLLDICEEALCNIKTLTEYRYFFKEQKIILYDKNEVHALSCFFQHHLTQHELSETLGFGKKVIQDLIKNGIFGQTFRNKRGGVNAWVISRHSLNDILETLEKGSSPKQTTNTCSLAEFLHLFGHTVGPYVMRALLQKEVFYHMPSQKLSEIHVAKEDLVSLSKAMIVEEGRLRGYFEQEEVLFLLGVKKRDLLYWIEKGLFPDIVSPFQIPCESYELFTEKYITTSQLSEILKVKTKRILKLHQMGRISSVSLSTDNRGGCLLFLRSVLFQSDNHKSLCSTLFRFGGGKNRK